MWLGLGGVGPISCVPGALTVGGSLTCRDSPSRGESVLEIVRTLSPRMLPKYKPTTHSMSHDHPHI